MISFRNAKIFFVYLIVGVNGLFLSTTLANDIDAPSASQSVAEEDVNAEVVEDTIQPDIDQNPHGYYRYEIDKVFDGKDFNGKKKVKSWRLKEKFTDKDEREGRVPNWIISIIEFFERNSQKIVTFSKVIEVLLWLVFGSLLFYLLIRYRKSIQQFVTTLGRHQNSVDLPSEMFGLDVRQESLPDDVVLTAHALWNSGDQRESFGLLLRGTLSKLLHDYDCQFQVGDTEMDCCQRVAQLGSPQLDHFMVELTTGWQQLAYAHHTPSQQTFDSVCQMWGKVFDAR